jgi:DNA-binding transcriptional regulator YdaS (Cro superfamily)
MIWAMADPSIQIREFGVVRLAALLGCRQSVVSNWLLRRSVPLNWCAPVEAATEGQVRCELLRPDVTWHRDESGAVTGYTIPVTTTAPTEKVA